MVNYIESVKDGAFIDLKDEPQAKSSGNAILEYKATSLKCRKYCTKLTLALFLPVGKFPKPKAWGKYSNRTVTAQ